MKSYKRKIKSTVLKPTLEVVEKYRVKGQRFYLKQLKRSLKEEGGYVSIVEQLLYDKYIYNHNYTKFYSFSEPNKQFTPELIKKLILDKRARHLNSVNLKRKEKEQAKDSNEKILNPINVCKSLKTLEKKGEFTEAEMETIFRSNNVPEALGFLLLHNNFIDVKNKGVKWIQKIDVNLKMVNALIKKLDDFNKMTSYELKSLDSIVDTYNQLGKVNRELTKTKNDLKTTETLLKNANEKIHQLKDVLSKSETNSDNVNAQIKSYQEQIENLKHSTYVLKGQVSYYKNNLEIAEEEIHKLKNENFKPFDSNTKERDYTKPNVDKNELESELGDPFENKDIVNRENPEIIEIYQIHEQIKELKDENQKLKEEIKYKNDEIEEGKRVEQDLRNEVARKNLEKKGFNAVDTDKENIEFMVMDEFDSRNTTKTKRYKLRLFGKTIFEREIVR